MNNLSINFVNNSDKWNNFILNYSSPNIINHSIFLDSWGTKKFFIKKNREILAGFSLFEENKTISLSENLLYTPLVYRNYKNIPVSSITNDKHIIINSLAEFLIKEKFSGEIRFDHFTTDMRPFLWKNFDFNKKLFVISDIKYTSILNINNLQINDFENSDFFKSMSVRTRQSYRYSVKRKKYIVKSYFDKQLIKNLINLTYKRQSKKIEFDIDKHLGILEKLQEEKLLESYVCEDEKGEKIGRASCRERV